MKFTTIPETGTIYETTVDFGEITKVKHIIMLTQNMLQK